MSLIIDFSIFPVDKGESVSAYVSKAVKKLQQSGLSFKVGPMGTAIEGDWGEVMALVKACMDEMAQDCHRVYVKKPECPARKSGDEWPSGLEANGRRWSATQPPSQNGFFFGRSPVRKHGVLHFTIKGDYRKGPSGRIESKMRSFENR